MNTACNSWSYYRTIEAKKMDQIAWVRECAALGLDGIELLGYHFPRTDRAYLVELKKLCADLYLTIAMVSAEGYFTGPDDARRQKEIESIRQWVEIAEFLGAPRVRFFCGKSAELLAGGPVLFKKVVKALSDVAAIGAEHGIVMALENHSGMTADQLLAILDAVNSPWLKLNLDTGNFPPTEKATTEAYAAIERCAPHAAIVHAKFLNVKPDGSDGEFDFKRIHGLLERAGFRGFLSVEYEGKDADEVAAMRRIAGFIKTLR